MTQYSYQNNNNRLIVYYKNISSDRMIGEVKSLYRLDPVFLSLSSDHKIKHNLPSSGGLLNARIRSKLMFR